LLPFLEDPTRLLSGRPLSDKYPTPILILFSVPRLYPVLLFNCFLHAGSAGSAALYDQPLV
jgi:hypothetical protein